MAYIHPIKALNVLASFASNIVRLYNCIRCCKVCKVAIYTLNLYSYLAIGLGLYCVTCLFAHLVTLAFPVQRQEYIANQWGIMQSCGWHLATYFTTILN